MSEMTEEERQKLRAQVEQERQQARKQIDEGMKSNIEKFSPILDEISKMTLSEVAALVCSILTSVKMSKTMDELNYAHWLYTIQLSVFKVLPMPPGISMIVEEVRKGKEEGHA